MLKERKALAGFFGVEQNRIVVDGADEVAGIGDGHRVLNVSVRGGSWSIPLPHAWMRDEWDRRHSNERSGTKWGIRTVRPDRPGGRIAVEIQATTWREARACQEALATPSQEALRKELIRSFLATGEAVLPNIGVVHCVAETSDAQFVLGQRSAHVHYHPLRWSCSYEEGLEPEDVNLGKSIFARAAARGAAEELLGGAPGDISEVVPLSVILERDLVNIAVVMLVRLGVSFAELIERWKSAPDRREFRQGSFRALPVELEGLARLLISKPGAAGNDPVISEWHPTARYRILAAMVYRFGEQRTLNALRAATSNVH